MSILRNSFRYCLIFVILLPAGVFLAFQTSCMKYPEGPLVSLRSKTERISNYWVIDQYLENGKNKTDSFKVIYADFVWRYGKDNSFDFFGKLNGVAWSRSGEWHFKEAKTEVALLNQASDSTYVMKIEKLKKQHLWLSQKDTATNIKREWHFKPRKI